MMILKTLLHMFIQRWKKGHHTMLLQIWSATMFLIFLYTMATDSTDGFNIYLMWAGGLIMGVGIKLLMILWRHFKEKFNESVAEVMKNSGPSKWSE